MYGENNTWMCGEIITNFQTSMNCSVYYYIYIYKQYFVILSIHYSCTCMYMYVN